MPLEEATRRFAFLLQRDLRRFEERDTTRTARGEEVRYDDVSRVATWETRRGDVVGRWYGEPLATYNVRDRILRWAWAFRRSPDDGTHAELVFREGQSRGVPQLAMSVVNDVDEDEAMTLARLGAVAARADGLHVVRSDDGESIDLIGLFESSRPSDRLRAASANRISVPPPPVAPRGSGSANATPPPRAAYRSLPPITEIYEPRRSSSPPAMSREEPPSDRDVERISDRFTGGADDPKTRIIPVANIAIASLGRRCPGWLQGLLVITVNADRVRDRDKRHLVVQLVALDADHHLRALDPPMELVESAASIADDARWWKLAARITPKADGGATLHVDVL